MSVPINIPKLGVSITGVEGEIYAVGDSIGEIG